MTKAEERAFEYQMSIGPNVIGGAGLLSEDEFKKLNTNRHFLAGYEQAEKDVLKDARYIEIYDDTTWKMVDDFVHQNMDGAYRVIIVKK